MAAVVVVGGGAAGMMAAIRAAQGGHQVTLAEHNEKLGKKLFITGKGRCNLTNSCDTEDYFSHVSRNPSFLYSSIYSFDHDAVVQFFTSHGLRVKEERGGRIFPASDHSSDVIRVLSDRLQVLGVKVLFYTDLVKIITGPCRDGDRAKDTAGREVTGIECVRLRDPAKARIKIPCQKLILATGGLSYASTGSDGSVLSLCRDLGHTIKPLRPCLVPLLTKEAYVTELMGLSLKNVSLSIRNGKKTVFQEFGEMLFTHFGVSGPLVLSASSRIPDGLFDLGDGTVAVGKKEGAREYLLKTGLEARIDLKPALDRDKLDRRLVRLFSENANKQFKNLLGDLLPAKMIPVMIRLSGIAPDKKANAITRAEREGLLGLLKAFPFTITGTRGFDEAIITRGGISVKEVDPSSMESRLVKGLYLAGEMLDLDALTGGYNLQIAWSTGSLAGLSV